MDVSLIIKRFGEPKSHKITCTNMFQFKSFFLDDIFKEITNLNKQCQKWFL